MDTLFVIDKKDYDPSGPRFSRTSARGVIIRNGKLALVRSARYGYVKFPGGGIEKGETEQQALIREVREETGLKVIPSSVRPFGFVLRLQKDSRVPGAVFEQRNSYYFCDAEAEPGETDRDAYEIEEGFTLVWMTAEEAIKTDRQPHSEEADPVMIDREARVLELLRDRYGL